MTDAGELGRRQAGVRSEGREGEPWVEAVDRGRPATSGEKTRERGSSVTTQHAEV